MSIKVMTVTALAAMALQGAVLLAETLVFDKPGDWEPVRRGSVQDDGVGIVQLSGELYATADLIAVNPEGETVLSGEFKRLPAADEDAKFCFAFMVYDRYMRRLDGMHVNVRPGTATELVAVCRPEDTVLKVRNAAKIVPHLYMVFDARDDLSDLPNRQVNPLAPVTGIKQTAADLWEVTLKEAVGRAAPAGTRVRAHSRSPYLYAGALMQPLPDDWTAVTGVVQGQEPNSRPCRQIVRFHSVAAFDQAEPAPGEM